MIEIDLLPGKETSKRRRSGGGVPFKLPEFGGGSDRMTVYIAAAWIVAVVAGLWMFLGVRGDMEDAQVALDQAVADSARLASIIQTQTALRARQDTIAQKLDMIQEIDAGRYVWPHILDEVSGALPPFTWLEGIEDLGGDAPPRFQITGRTGSLPALTRFMDALEASPFLRDVQLISSEQAPAGGDVGGVLNNFVLTGLYEVPPLDAVETVPLFEDASDTATTGEATNGAGTS